MMPGSLRALRCAQMILVVLCAVAPAVHALEFHPSAVEWAAWPEQCRVRYVVSGAGQTSRYAKMISPATVRAFKARDPAWKSRHHFCAGLIRHLRGLQAGNAKTAAFEFQSALNEATYSIAHASLPQTHIALAEHAIFIARVQVAMKQFDAARSVLLNDVLKHHPKHLPAHLMLAELERARKDIAAERRVLLAADALFEGQSGAVHFALAMSYLSSNDRERARTHTERARALGQSVAVLEQKLARK